MSSATRLLQASGRFALRTVKRITADAKRSTRKFVADTAKSLDRGARPGLRYVHPAGSPYVAADNAMRNLDTIAQKLAAADIEWVQLPQLSRLRPRIVVDSVHTPKVIEIVEELQAREGWRRRLVDLNNRSVTTRAARKIRLGAVAAGRAYFSSGGTEVSTHAEQVTIEFWERVGEDEPRADGTTYVPGTLRRGIQARGLLVEYLTPGQWHEAVADGNKVQLNYPHLFDVIDPIDVVYTWVDDDDPDWQKRKADAHGELDLKSINETAINASRFNNREELRYSLRSLEMYADWVNHIYIVTDRQVPEWLNVDNPKITVVDHSEIFADTSALPVFNSHAIESQLHHIPGLSDKYVYMNDDIVFLRPTNPSLFFYGNGNSKFFKSTAPLDLAPPSARDLPVLSAAKHNRELIEQTFGRTITNKLKHTPHPQQKSVLERLEAEHPEIFRKVSHSTFRHPDDLSITSALHHWYAYGLGKAAPAGIRYGYVNLASETAEKRLDSFSRSRTYDVLCVNETETTPERAAEIDVFLAEFFHKRFPFKSSFEK